MRFFWLYSLIAVNALAGQPDQYQSFSDLASHRKEGSDFTVSITEREGQPLVQAIHGGEIEPGTEELARTLAGQDWSLYVFHARVPGLHLTAHHFDDARIVQLAGRSGRCVGIHGYAEHADHQADTCVGGADAALRGRVAQALRRIGTTTEEPCRLLPGVHPRNVVNLSPRGGVQLEMSQAFRRKLGSDSKLRSRWIRALRRAVLR